MKRTALTLVDPSTILVGYITDEVEDEFYLSQAAIETGLVAEVEGRKALTLVGAWQLVANQSMVN